MISYSTVSSEDWEWKITYERDFSKATDGAKKILGDMDVHPLAFKGGCGDGFTNGLRWCVTV